MKYKGLSFEKFDLHVHTPASHDFQEKTISPQQIVEHAIKSGLRGIAITDHHTGDFIDSIKKARGDKKLAIFPGVEITCTAGKSGIHIIALLDVDKGQKHIEDLLANIDIGTDKRGKKDTVTDQSPNTVINEIHKQGGIAVLAHCTSSKGVLSEMRGSVRTEIFNNHTLLAVEVSEHDFTDPDKRNKKTRAVDLLNGSDENYANRKLAVYISSDSRITGEEPHNLSAIGSKYTYFKVDEEINLESLRQCFIDRDVRIRQAYEYVPTAFTRILQVSIEGGFFHDQQAQFHIGLNSVLGAKGSGKSLLIELMRFALNQTSSDRLISDDHNSKLKKRLDTYGKVKVQFMDSTGAVCNIERMYDPAEGNPYSEDSEESLAESFTVLFLSQNEIIRIAEDETAQIEFIDQFFDFRHYRDQIANIEKDLLVLDKQFASGLRAIEESKEVDKQTAARNIELGKIDKSLADPIYEKYKALELKNTCILSHIAFLEDFSERIEAKRKEIDEINYPDVNSLLQEEPIIKRLQFVIKQTKAEAIKNLLSCIEDIANGRKMLYEEYEKWKPQFVQEKKKYEDYVRSAGGDKTALEAQRTRLLKEKDQLDKRNVKLKEEVKILRDIQAQRERLMGELSGVYKDYSRERQDKCVNFESQSNGRLRVSIGDTGNASEFRQQLLDMKKGSYLREADIDQICNSIQPSTFILALLRYHAKRDPKQIDAIAETVKLEKEKILQLCEYLLAQVNYEKLLALQYKARPQDRPEIRFKVAEDRYELLKNISVGQKCTAMLLMALSEGTFPIVIDQPEDSLDIRSVWDDMCLKIRGGKEKRQFIFTTHNSCLAVASDTDKYIIVEGDANTGKVVMSGALDNPVIKQQVIKYLEGGPKTYEAKAEKYGVSR